MGGGDRVTEITLYILKTFPFSPPKQRTCLLKNFQSSASTANRAFDLTCTRVPSCKGFMHYGFCSGSHRGAVIGVACWADAWLAQECSPTEHPPCPRLTRSNAAIFLPP